MSSDKPTPWAVICEGSLDGIPGCGKVYLTEEEYRIQLTQPNKTWRCPSCHYEAMWDDDNYEEFYKNLMGE